MSTVNETKDPTLTDGKGGASFLGSLWASVAVTLILGVIVCGIYPLAVWAVAQAVFPHQANGSLLKKDGSKSKDDTDVIGSSLIGQQFTQAIYFHPRPSAANNSAGTSFSSTGGYDPTASGGTNYGPLSDALINGSFGAAPPPPAPPATTAPATTEPAAIAPTTAPVVATTAPASTEMVTFDGIRLRTFHYASDNGLSFKLYSVKPDGSRTEVPAKQFQDDQGAWNDLALVKAFPHPTLTGTTPDSVIVAGPFTKPDGTAVLIPADAVTASGSGLDPHISPANAMLQAQRVADQRKLNLKQVQDLISKNTDGPDLGFLGDPGVNVTKLNLALDVQYPVKPEPSTQPAK